MASLFTVTVSKSTLYLALQDTCETRVVNAVRACKAMRVIRWKR
jgi:hypothetical protein